MKRVAVIQSNYIPWKGYFDIIHDVDLFVFLDDVQFTSRDWRNRNKIKTARGPQWLTIPTGSDRNRLIHEVTLSDHAWQSAHWATIAQLYAAAPEFKRYREFFRDAYLGRQWTNLSAMNQHLIEAISTTFLEITTQFADSRAYAPEGSKQHRLIDILTKVQATHYLSGPTAREYLDAAAFEAAGIELVYKSYDGYPEYPQLHPPFEHAVSILDLLFNVGPRAPEFIWGWRERQHRLGASG
jgi:WbqC-like protein family